jgi:hypothetical protein
MVTDGGGWMLALNYRHAAGTNPPLSIRSLASGPPLLGAAIELWADESASFFTGGSWGHLTRSALAAVRSPAPLLARPSAAPHWLHSQWLSLLLLLLPPLLPLLLLLVMLSWAAGALAAAGPRPQAPSPSLTRPPARPPPTAGKHQHRPLLRPH